MANEKRLIELDHALQAVAEQYTTDTTERELNMFCDIRQRLRTLPTVEAVEVVHGRWIHVPSSDMMTGKAYKCSECGKMRYGSYMPNYCQCCGAKMDGDEDDNDT